MLKIKENDKFVLKGIYGDTFNFVILPPSKSHNVILHQINHVFHICRFKKFINLPHVYGNFFVYFFDSANLWSVVDMLKKQNISGFFCVDNFFINTNVLVYNRYTNYLYNVVLYYNYVFLFVNFLNWLFCFVVDLSVFLSNILKTN